MPYAVTHILIAVIIVELFRKYIIKSNKKFPRYYILFAAIGGLIPDLDIAFFYVLYFFGFTFEQIHRTFMHSIIIPLGLFLIGLFVLKAGVKLPFINKRHINLSTIFFIFAGGSFVHLLLDLVLGSKFPILYPLILTDFGLDLLKKFPAELRELIAPTLDGILLLFWIIWMQFKLKIDDYF